MRASRTWPFWSNRCSLFSLALLREQLGILHRSLLVIVRDDEVCRRLMTVPAVGPVVAQTYRATVDVPARFRNSKAVGDRRADLTLYGKKLKL